MNIFIQLKKGYLMKKERQKDKNTKHKGISSKWLRKHLKERWVRQNSNSFQIVLTIWLSWLFMSLNWSLNGRNTLEVWHMTTVRKRKEWNTIFTMTIISWKFSLILDLSRCLSWINFMSLLPKMTHLCCNVCWPSKRKKKRQLNMSYLSTYLCLKRNILRKYWTNYSFFQRSIDTISEAEKYLI